MAEKVGGSLGMLTAWIVWRSIGGIKGFLVAILVAPLVSALFIGPFSAMRGKPKSGGAG